MVRLWGRQQNVHNFVNTSFNHSWALSQLSVHFDFGLSPISDHSKIELIGTQSDIISDIGLTFLAMPDIRY
jgi:hypothetical protein